MAGSVLHTLIEVSELFQELLRLAAADGVVDSWGLEMILQNVSLSLHEDDNFHGHLLFGLHSLLLLLARKLEDLGHEIYTDVCRCGWDTSQLPESQHTDIHRYTSGTVVRWVQGECYVLLASTEAEAQMYHDGEQEDQTDDGEKGKLGKSVEDQHKENFTEELISEEPYIKDTYHQGQEEHEDNHMRDSGEELDPSHAIPSNCEASSDDLEHRDDAQCCRENDETECCHSSGSAAHKTTDFVQGDDNECNNPHTRLPSDSKKLPSVWSGCQIHSCSTEGGKYDHKWKKSQKRFSKSADTVTSKDIHTDLSCSHNYGQECLDGDCEPDDQVEACTIKQEVENVESVGEGVCNGLVKKYVKREVDLDGNCENRKSARLSSETDLFTFRNQNNQTSIDISCENEESDSGDSGDQDDNEVTNEYQSSEEEAASENEKSDGEARSETGSGGDAMSESGGNDKGMSENDDSEEGKSRPRMQVVSPMEPPNPDSPCIDGSMSAEGSIMSEDSIDGDNSCTLIIHEEETREGEVSREKMSDGMSSPHTLKDVEPCKQDTDEERMTQEKSCLDKVSRAVKEDEHRNLETLDLPYSYCSLLKEKMCNSESFGLQDQSNLSNNTLGMEKIPGEQSFDDEQHNDYDDDDDDDDDESDDDDSSSVTTTSSSSSSSSSSSDDDDRISFKQRVERAAQAAREAEASAAALLSASATNHETSRGSDGHNTQLPNQVLLHQKLDQGQLDPHADDQIGSNSVVSSSEDIAPHDDENAAAVTRSTAPVYVDPPSGSLNLTPHLACPEPVEVVHSGRDPADLQAAQGLADLQRGQSLSLSSNPSVSTPNPMTFMVNELQEIPLEIRRSVGGKGLECVVCGKVFNRLLKLKQHHRTHTGERPWGCNNCGKTFSTASYLQKHRLTCLIPAHQRQFSCYVCHRGFGLRSSLQTHLATHATNKPFTCDICGQSFALKFTRDTHKAQHTGSRPWVCSVCGRSYVTKYKLRAHMKAHTGELVCSVCGRQFTSQDSLGRHQRLHEGSGKNPVLPTCHVCNKKFATPSLLKRHVASHERQNSLKCTVCGQDFVNHQQMTAHHSQHQQSPLSKSHKCHVCNKLFVQESSLTRHLANHTNATFHQQNSTQSLPAAQTKDCNMDTTSSQLNQGLDSLQQSDATCFIAEKKPSLFQQAQTTSQMSSNLGQQACGGENYLEAVSQQHTHHLQNAQQLHIVTVGQTQQQEHLISNRTSSTSRSSNMQAQVFLPSVSYDPQILGTGLQDTAYQQPQGQE